MPTSDISTIKGYADSCRVDWKKRCRFWVKSEVSCLLWEEIGGFHHKSLPSGWGKTLAQGFKMTALQFAPKLFLFLHKTIQIENENRALSCWCVSSGLPSCFIVNSEKKGQWPSSVQGMSGACEVPPFHSRHTASPTQEMSPPPPKKTKTIQIILLGTTLGVPLILGKSLTTRLHVQHASNLKYKVSELWQTLLDSKQEGPLPPSLFLETYSNACALT